MAIVRRQNRQWVQLDEEPAANFPMSLYYIGAAQACNRIGAHAGPIALVYHGRSVRECVVKGGFATPGKAILQKLRKDPRFLRWMWHTTRQQARLILRFSQQVAGADLSALTDAELLRIYERWTGLALRTLSASTYGTVLEFEEPLLSGPLYEYLKGTVPPRYANDVGTIFTVLTTPTGVNENRTTEIKLIEIALKFRQVVPASSRKSVDACVRYCQARNPELLLTLERYHGRFSYLSYGYSGPKKPFAETIDDFFRHLKLSKTLLQRKRRDLIAANKAIRQQQVVWFKRAGVDAEHRTLFVLLRELAGLKRWRKKLMVRCQYLVHELVVEISKRLGISLAEAQTLSHWEMYTAIAGKLSRPYLRRRAQQTVVWIDGMRWKVLPFGEARAIISEINRSLQVKGSVQELHGMCACAGKAEGHVKILRNASDLPKFNAGDIIVSPATSPELVPAMRRARAIITDAGGITSHAAIVSRELGVPCVIGTKIATKVLKDDDKVSVDAGKGIIKRVQ
ncbi:MAG: PEP-utilizing enzyme [Patescibacteria group bacterium]|nr:PEP-utilizing enzyme [Patescibacteria group bacterium]MDD5715479.1 PEP-utilizing enzyme [Patescibacteria group bacterium]